MITREPSGLTEKAVEWIGVDETRPANQDLERGIPWYFPVWIVRLQGLLAGRGKGAGQAIASLSNRIGEFALQYLLCSAGCRQARPGFPITSPAIGDAPPRIKICLPPMSGEMKP